MTEEEKELTGANPKGSLDKMPAFAGHPVPKQAEYDDDEDPSYDDDDDYDEPDEPLRVVMKRAQAGTDNARTGMTHWIIKEPGTYILSGSEEKTQKVKPGVYKIDWNRDWGKHLVEKKMVLDELLTLPTPIQEQVLSDIRKFWARKEIFKKYKYTYKRGILLYGAPGNGKSSIINLLCEEIIKKHHGIVFFLSTPTELEYFTGFIPQFRIIEPETPILCVLEDLETLAAHHESETLLLNTLDGANQMHNIVYMGCTNYPENLKERLLNRPNRFDKRYEIGHPDLNVRKFYFEKKLMPEDLAEHDIDDWAKRTDGYSMAHLGEIIKSVCVLGNSFEETLKTLEKMKENLDSHNFGKETGGIGFGGRKKY